MPLSTFVRAATVAIAVGFGASALAAGAQPPARALLGAPLTAATKQPAQPAFRARAAELALFLRESSRRAEQMHLPSRVNAFARHMEAESGRAFASLGVPDARLSLKWRNELDQLIHLPAENWKTRYPLDAKQALEETLRLCRNYSRHGANSSTRHMALNWATAIRKDIPRAEQLGRAR